MANKLLAIFAVALIVTLTVPAAAQKWPDKPIRLVVPYPPGGNVDGAARIVAESLVAAFGRPFVIENKPGAGGMIAAEYAAKSPPDGYTFFVAANGPLLYSPLIFGRSTYQWDKDFVPISSISFTPLILQVHTTLPPRTLKEFIDLAKAKPGALTMASPGAGTTNHLVSEMLQQLTGAKWTTVHYKGNAPATSELLGGQVDFNFDQVSVALPYVKAKRLRALAITTAQRHPALPEVPTFAQAGVKGMEAATFTGILAPAGTPKEIVNRMSEVMRGILKEKSVIEKFDAQGAEARGASPEEFQAYLKHEYDTWTPIIRKANIKAN